MHPRITVLTLGVRDLAAALAFYRDGLGFQTPGIIGTEFENGAAVFIELESGLKLALWPIQSLSTDAGIPRYQIPAFMLHGQLVYFAAFKKHIGFYPPVTGGDQPFKKAIAVYAGPKGNLQFPLDKPIPYALIAKIVKLRVKENLAKASAKNKKSS